MILFGKRKNSWPFRCTAEKRQLWRQKLFCPSLHYTYLYSGDTVHLVVINRLLFFFTLGTFISVSLQRKTKRKKQSTKKVMCEQTQGSVNDYDHKESNEKFVGTHFTDDVWFLLLHIRSIFDLVVGVFYWYLLVANDWKIENICLQILWTERENRAHPLKLILYFVRKNVYTPHLTFKKERSDGLTPSSLLSFHLWLALSLLCLIILRTHYHYHHDDLLIIIFKWSRVLILSISFSLLFFPCVHRLDEKSCFLLILLIITHDLLCSTSLPLPLSPYFSCSIHPLNWPHTDCLRIGEKRCRIKEWSFLFHENSCFRLFWVKNY